ELAKCSVATGSGAHLKHRAPGPNGAGPPRAEFDATCPDPRPWHAGRHRMRSHWNPPIAVLAAALALASAVEARPIRWARSQDALTLDPHAQNEGRTPNQMHLIYEPLVDRDTRDGSLMPTLASAWTLTSDPSVWEFKLRPNVTFHNGNPLSADDVVFSFTRALQPTSDLRGTIS